MGQTKDRYERSKAVRNRTREHAAAHYRTLVEVEARRAEAVAAAHRPGCSPAALADSASALLATGLPASEVAGLLGLPEAEF